VRVRVYTCSYVLVDTKWLLWGLQICDSYMCMSLYMYVSMSMFVSVCAFLFVSVPVSVSVSVSVSAYTLTHICMFRHIYMYISSNVITTGASRICNHTGDRPKEWSGLLNPENPDWMCGEDSSRTGLACGICKEGISM